MYEHKPRTLFNVEEEENEDVVSYHSERLAISFALMFLVLVRLFG